MALRPRTKTTRAEAYGGPRPDILALMPSWKQESVVVDVGCASGAFGATLQDAGQTVVGIELDPVAAQEASKRLSRVICADAATGLRTIRDEGLQPSVIVFGDVLEHLVDPWLAVDLAVESMPQGGWIVASIPNVAHYDTIIHLLRGTWPVRERGIHDDTHLRFFARKDLPGLVARRRSRVDLVRRTYRIIERPARINQLAPLLGWMWPNGLTYQFLVRVAVDPEQ